MNILTNFSILHSISITSASALLTLQCKHSTVNVCTTDQSNDLRQRKNFVSEIKEKTILYEQFLLNKNHYKFGSFLLLISYRRYLWLNLNVVLHLYYYLWYQLHIQNQEFDKIFVALFRVINWNADVSGFVYLPCSVEYTLKYDVVPHLNYLGSQFPSKNLTRHNSFTRHFLEDSMYYLHT